MAKVGRPSLYTPELAQEICEKIASSELGLANLVKENPHWPDRANIFIWMRKHSEFRDMYAKAKEEQVEVCVDYLQEMANEPHHYIDDNGNQRIDVGMLRVKMDAVKWTASKLKAKKYGDIKQQENVNQEVDDDIKKRYAEMDERNKKEY